VINVRWDNARNSYERQEWILLVKNGDEVVDFVKVAVSPSLLLAHEFKHFLYALHVAARIGKRRRKAGSLLSAIEKDAENKYHKVLKGIFKKSDGTKCSAASKSVERFKGCLNHGNYEDTLLIFPVQDILQTGETNWPSDGKMVKEALDHFPEEKKPTFRQLSNNAELYVNYENTSAEGFVRFGHCSVAGLNETLNLLSDDERANFRSFIVYLLKKFKSAAGVSLTLNDLPTIPAPV
jgi:hypothetical protein